MKFWFFRGLFPVKVDIVTRLAFSRYISKMPCKTFGDFPAIFGCIWMGLSGNSVGTPYRKGRDSLNSVHQKEWWAWMSFMKCVVMIRLLWQYVLLLPNASIYSSSQLPTNIVLYITITGKKWLPNDPKIRKHTTYSYT